MTKPMCNHFTVLYICASKLGRFNLLLADIFILFPVHRKHCSEPVVSTVAQKTKVRIQVHQYRGDGIHSQYALVNETVSLYYQPKAIDELRGKEVVMSGSEDGNSAPMADYLIIFTCNICYSIPLSQYTAAVDSMSGYSFQLSQIYEQACDVADTRSGWSVSSCSGNGGLSNSLPAHPISQKIPTSKLVLKPAN